jgi:hypothetical protein
VNNNQLARLLSHQLNLGQKDSMFFLRKKEHRQIMAATAFQMHTGPILNLTADQPDRYI